MKKVKCELCGKTYAPLRRRNFFMTTFVVGVRPVQHLRVMAVDRHGVWVDACRACVRRLIRGIK